MNNIANIQGQAVAVHTETFREGFIRDPVPANQIATADRHQLIPRDDCLAVKAQIESAPMPIQTEARATGNRIILCHQSEKKDPIALATLLSEFTNDLLKVPLHLHNQVFDTITRVDRFFPTRAALADAIREVLAPRNAALHIAERHLGRHRILDKHHPEPVPQADPRQKLVSMPERSILTETVAKALSTMPGRIPSQDDADLVSRFSAPPEAAKPAEPPIRPMTVSLPRDERRAALLHNHHMRSR